MNNTVNTIKYKLKMSLLLFDEIEAKLKNENLNLKVFCFFCIIYFIE